MTREELMSALFANMVLQQTNLAMMFLGRVPHPETGEHTRDLEMAQMFIDQLEMLEAKTKNNLTKQEEMLLRQSLTAVRMAYVEGVNEPEQKPAGKVESGATSPPGSAAEGQSRTAGEATEPEENRKKFSKKY